AALGEDVCLETGDEVMKAYAAFGRWGSTISKDVTALAKGTIHPIHSRPGMAATTRTTESNPNTQNWGTGWGPRECIVPRAGTVFIQADYPQLELKTLAQTCIDLFGFSAMADAINAGQDLHLKFAAVVLGITYEEAERTKKNKDVKNARDLGKVNNFGRPGGLGDKNLVAYAKKNFGISLGKTQEESIEKAREMKEQWFAAFPEMKLYFEYMSNLCNTPSGLGEIVIPRSKQLRGGAMYCALCNTPFQGLGAVCSGRALWLIAKACYVDRSSVLFGSRNVFHVHDENILECPDDDLVHERAMELARLMDVGANEYLVDVPMKTDPQAMRKWSKEAFTLKRHGRIVAWDEEWRCEECNVIFPAPFPVGKKRKCSEHTEVSPWQ
ncbi:MAG: DNA polymerase, partial [Thaumarchaeota archaeon]|nr:DNA polymerase [Nitrososphaerota archaeon]